MNIRKSLHGVPDYSSCFYDTVQYLGDRTSEKVKTRVIEMLFSWTISLPEETKIREAYQMLKLQGESSSAVRHTLTKPQPAPHRLQYLTAFISANFLKFKQSCWLHMFFLL